MPLILLIKVRLLVTLGNNIQETSGVIIFFSFALSYNRNYVSICLTCNKRNGQQKEQVPLADATHAVNILERNNIKLVELPKSDKKKSSRPLWSGSVITFYPTCTTER